MRAAIERFSAVLSVLAGGCVIVLMTWTGFEVARRYLTGRSYAPFIEYSEVLLIAVFYLSVAYAQKQRIHVEVESVARYLPARLRPALEAFGLAVVLAFLLIFLQSATGRAIASVASGEYRMGLARVPLWPGRVLVAVGLAALSLQFALALWDRTRQALGREEPEALIFDTDGQPGIEDGP